MASEAATSEPAASTAVGATSMSVVRVAAPIRQQVTDRLRSALAQQQFRPGDRLVERHLCDLTGASRASVREALRQLEAEGLVVNVPQVGMFVASVTRQDAELIYTIRGVLEGLAARLFARNSTPALRAALRQVATELAEAQGSNDLLATKDRFYAVLFAGAGSPIIDQLLSPLHARVAVLRGRSLSHPGRSIASMSEIRAIVDAIDSGDADAAAEAASFHVSQAAETLFADWPDDMT